VLALIAAPLGLVWLVLRWAGAGVPSLGGLGEGPPGGAGWLVLSSVAGLAVLVVGMGLVAWMFLSDSVPDPLPRRLYLAWLLPVLPIVDGLSVIAAWICFALGRADAARYLGAGPWLAGLALGLVAAVVYSGLVAHER
jgi:hypothetical protein